MLNIVVFRLRTTYCTLLRKITAYIDRLVKKQEKSKKGKLLTH